MTPNPAPARVRPLDAAFVIRVAGLDNPACPVRCHYIVVPWSQLTRSERALFGAYGYTWFDRNPGRRGER